MAIDAVGNDCPYVGKNSNHQRLVDNGSIYGGRFGAPVFLTSTTVFCEVANGRSLAAD
jgi:hypothetical protein